MEINFLLPLGVWMTYCSESCLWDMQVARPRVQHQMGLGLLNCVFYVSPSCWLTEKALQSKTLKKGSTFVLHT